MPPVHAPPPPKTLTSGLSKHSALICMVLFVLSLCDYGFSGGSACAKGYCPSLVSVTDSMLPALVPPSGLYSLLQVNFFFVFENVPSSSGFSVFDKMCFRCRRLMGSSVM